MAPSKAVDHNAALLVRPCWLLLVAHYRRGINGDHQVIRAAEYLGLHGGPA
ncbi:hypothetical protein [Streptomyces sp. NPDC057302]|uniref:hypothetical protein n=1 Tax=Streptomyces sp. NPDC057302 TaxID=3346094 RepID=UPI003630DFDB